MAMADQKLSWARPIMLALMILTIGGIIVAGCMLVGFAEPVEISGDAGFFSGVWHGFIAPIAFICKLFGADVAIYDVHNTGGWYDFGFLLGVGSTLSSAKR